MSEINPNDWRHSAMPPRVPMDGYTDTAVNATVETQATESYTCPRLGLGQRFGKGSEAQCRSLRQVLKMHGVEIADEECPHFVFQEKVREATSGGADIEWGRSCDAS